MPHTAIQMDCNVLNATLCSWFWLLKDCHNCACWVHAHASVIKFRKQDKCQAI